MDNVELAGKLYVIYHKEMEGNKLTNVKLKIKEIDSKERTKHCNTRKKRVKNPFNSHSLLSISHFSLFPSFSVSVSISVYLTCLHSDPGLFQLSIILFVYVLV